MSSIPTDYPRLVADIGGTNARFALEVAPQQIEQAHVLPCKDYDTIVDAAREYLRLTDCQSDCRRLGADDQPPLGVFH